MNKIGRAYSKISFSDIADKLYLPKNENVELIVAKAIRDGVIRATIDHDGGFITITEKSDLYTTNEP